MHFLHFIVFVVYRAYIPLNIFFTKLTSGFQVNSRYRRNEITDIRAMKRSLTAQAGHIWQERPDKYYRASRFYNTTHLKHLQSQASMSTTYDVIFAGGRFLLNK